jgi:hypothetical protein
LKFVWVLLNGEDEEGMRRDETIFERTNRTGYDDRIDRLAANLFFSGRQPTSRVNHADSSIRYRRGAISERGKGYTGFRDSLHNSSVGSLAEGYFDGVGHQYRYFNEETFDMGQDFMFGKITEHL